jgi:predicted component of type VI protein secretion system
MDVKLVGFKPDGDRVEITLTKPATIFGRGTNCDVQIPVSSISRQHCEVNVAGDQVWVADLGSSNGTFVNNERVDEMRLTAGDRLVFGPLVLTVQIDGVPADIVAPSLEPAPVAAVPAEVAEVADDDDLAAVMMSDVDDPLSALSDDSDDDAFALTDDAGDADSDEAAFGLAPEAEVAPADDDPFAVFDDDGGDDDDPFASLADDNADDDQPLL